MRIRAATAIDPNSTLTRLSYLWWLLRSSLSQNQPQHTEDERRERTAAGCDPPPGNSGRRFAVAGVAGRFRFAGFHECDARGRPRDAILDRERVASIGGRQFLDLPEWNGDRTRHLTRVHASRQFEPLLLVGCGTGAARWRSLLRGLGGELLPAGHLLRLARGNAVKRASTSPRAGALDGTSGNEEVERDRARGAAGRLIAGRRLAGRGRPRSLEERVIWERVRRLNDGGDRHPLLPIRRPKIRASGGECNQQNNQQRQ